MTDNVSSSAKYLSSKKEVSAAVEELFDIVLERHNTIKEAQESDSEYPEYPTLVYVISSLKDLQEQLTEEQAEKLSLILEKGSVKLNIYILIAETSKNVSSFNFEKWYVGNVSQSDGVWVGSGVADQYYIKLNKTTSDMNEEMSTAFGYSINSGKAVKIKLINDGEEK